MSTLLNPADIANRLAAPFDPTEVKFKPAVVSGHRALAIAYVDVRAVLDRLDAVLGVDGWKDAYTVLVDSSVMCSLSLRIGEDWITKSDVGSQSEQPDEGDRMKAAFSDALKRAAVKFGIGRYLYRLPAQWVDIDPQKRQFVKTPTLAAPKAKTMNTNGTATIPGPQTTKCPVEPIGSTGAKKLLDLASRKRVRLEDHLGAVGAAGVSQFQVLSEISKEIARKVYAQLTALP